MAWLPLILQAQDGRAALREKAAAEALRLEPQCIAWRRDLHQHPELGNRETRTASIVASHLRALGIETRENLARTGVVGILRGSQPGPCIALRADMDALPLTERNALPFASNVRTQYNGQEVGVMHACGHDAHTAMLMTVAEILSGMRNQLKGTVKFIFQPAEEGPPEGEEGGALLMIREGVMDDPPVSAIFGIHVDAGLESGYIAYKPGAFMASADWFTVRVNGRGSHGSQPWKSIDPIQVSAQIIEGLQSIVSRQMNIVKAPVVITVGRINGGVRQNIIPETCEFSGTIRTLDSAMQLDVQERIRKTAASIAAASGATATVMFDTKTLVTFNQPALVDRALPSLVLAAGKERVRPTNWVTLAEDFSYYGTRAPAFMFQIGVMPRGQDPDKAPAHHTPDFHLDESGMITGVKAFCSIVIDLLK
ncbi:MAG: hypothetical protein RJA57_1011 [Bacteroidota bacterium]